jgi:hypothetical protein
MQRYGWAHIGRRTLWPSRDTQGDLAERLGAEHNQYKEAAVRLAVALKAAGSTPCVRAEFKQKW